MKRQMRGIEYQTVDNVIQKILDVVGDITQEQWEYCYEQWIARCEKCIQYDERYFEGMKFAP